MRYVAEFVQKGIPADKKENGVRLETSLGFQARCIATVHYGHAMKSILSRDISL
jgi:hypothetical protein